MLKRFLYLFLGYLIYKNRIVTIIKTQLFREDIFIILLKISYQLLLNYL
jgi:hypothetical protein